MKTKRPIRAVKGKANPRYATTDERISELERAVYEILGQHNDNPWPKRVIANLLGVRRDE